MEDANCCVRVLQGYHPRSLSLWLHLCMRGVDSQDPYSAAQWFKLLSACVSKAASAAKPNKHTHRRGSTRGGGGVVVREGHHAEESVVYPSRAQYQLWKSTEGVSKGPHDEDMAAAAAAEAKGKGQRRKSSRGGFMRIVSSCFAPPASPDHRRSSLGSGHLVRLTSSSMPVARRDRDLPPPPPPPPILESTPCTMGSLGNSTSTQRSSEELNQDPDWCVCPAVVEEGACMKKQVYIESGEGEGGLCASVDAEDVVNRLGVLLLCDRQLVLQLALTFLQLLLPHLRGELRARVLRDALLSSPVSRHLLLHWNSEVRHLFCYILASKLFISPPLPPGALPPPSPVPSSAGMPSRRVTFPARRTTLQKGLSNSSSQGGLLASGGVLPSVGESSISLESDVWFTAHAYDPPELISRMSAVVSAAGSDVDSIRSSMDSMDLARSDCGAASSLLSGKKKKPRMKRRNNVFSSTHALTVQLAGTTPTRPLSTPVMRSSGSGGVSTTPVGSGAGPLLSGTSKKDRGEFDPTFSLATGNCPSPRTARRRASPPSSPGMGPVAAVKAFGLPTMPVLRLDGDGDDEPPISTSLPSAVSHRLGGARLSFSKKERDAGMGEGALLSSSVRLVLDEGNDTPPVPVDPIDLGRLARSSSFSHGTRAKGRDGLSVTSSPPSSMLSVFLSSLNEEVSVSDESDPSPDRSNSLTFSSSTSPTCSSPKACFVSQVAPFQYPIADKDIDIMAGNILDKRFGELVVALRPSVVGDIFGCKTHGGGKDRRKSKSKSKERKGSVTSVISAAACCADRDGAMLKHRMGGNGECVTCKMEGCVCGGEPGVNKVPMLDRHLEAYAAHVLGHYRGMVQNRIKKQKRKRK